MSTARAALVIFCLVAASAAGAARAQGVGPGLPAPGLPADGDLTLAAGAGTVLIGMTVRPAQPGPNTLLVYVLPSQGPSVAADVPVSLAVDGQPVALEFCSRSCRSAEVTLSGGEHLDLVAGGPAGGAVGFDLPALPASDGSALLEQISDRMHQLHTYRVDESVGPAAPPLQASYLFQAPDRMRLDVANGSQTIFVGSTRYTRPDASSAWMTESIGVSLPVPSLPWDVHTPDEQLIAPRIVGFEEVDGVPTQVVSFFQHAGNTLLWFRVWADADGLVHRAQMDGQGHFMQDDYADFDAPLSIEPPGLNQGIGT